MRLPPSTPLDKNKYQRSLWTVRSIPPALRIHSFLLNVFKVGYSTHLVDSMIFHI